jgi:flagellar motor switch protein FliN
MDNPMDEKAIEEEMERAMMESMEQAGAESPSGAPMTTQLEDVAGVMGSASTAPISTLYGLSLPVSIELGRTSMKVQEVLHLGRGSVIELDRLAGEPVDVFVGDRRFAEGEVVVLGENFGVRITRILPAAGGENG